MSTKNITLIFNHFETEHLGKDVFLVPYYLGKILDYSVTIVYPLTETNKNFPHVIRGVRLIPLPLYGNNKSHYIYREAAFFNYIFKNAKKIDLLIRFHHTIQTEIITILYKFLNPKGKVYVKLDINPLQIEHQPERNFIKRIIHNCITKRFIKSTTIATCETSQTYEMIKKSYLIKNRWEHKLFLLPNGFDEECLKTLNLKENIYKDKENIFITVGRIGAYEKNTKFILDTLKKVDLKTWKFYFIGPIENSFKEEINKFYSENPTRINKIIFTGPISKKQELWEYYNRAKVFVFSSKWESYGLVYNEAKRFRNFIVSTRVGAFEDITCNETYGIAYKQESETELSNILNTIINNKLRINVYDNFNAIDISWLKILQNISHKLT